jgi:hypothetical protein
MSRVLLVHADGGRRGRRKPPARGYKFEFVCGDDTGREPMTVHCVDDAQAWRWASGFAGGHLGAEVWREQGRWAGLPLQVVNPDAGVWESGGVSRP